MRPIRHLTPRYVADRLALAFYEFRNPDIPWLTPEMVAILESWLQPNDIGLEWGSGRSTTWFAQRVDHITSVEHHPEWFEKVRNDLRAEGQDYCTELVHIDADADNQYAGVIDRFDDESLDFCLVDGRFRDLCAIAALAKVRPGGVIIIDDSQRYLPAKIDSTSPNGRSVQEGPASERWQDFQRTTSDWRCIWTTSGVTDTAMWIKPPTNFA